QQLVGLGYQSVRIADGTDLLSNLQAQLESFNKTKFSQKEFNTILNHLAKGTVFDKAKTLKDRYHLSREDGTSFYVRFFNGEDPSKNLYQVSNQITLEG